MVSTFFYPNKASFTTSSIQVIYFLNTCMYLQQISFLGVNAEVLKSLFICVLLLLSLFSGEELDKQNCNPNI